MPKNLTHWELAMVRAQADKHAADRNAYIYGWYVTAPVRWKKMGSFWRRLRGDSGRDPHYPRLRADWVRHRRLGRLAVHEQAKANRRVTYIQERIDDLKAKTAWTRVLGRTVV